MRTTHPKPATVYFGLAIGVIAVSFAAVLIRLADAPFLVISAFRISLASLVVVPAAVVYQRDNFAHITRKDLMLLGGSAVCLALHFVFWIASLSYTSVASSVILVTSSPIVVALVSHFLVKERVSRNVVAGIGLVSVGSLVLGWGDFRVGAGELYGDFLVLLGAVAAAGYLLLGRQARSSLSVLPYISFVYAGAAVILLAAMIAVGEPFTGYSAKTYVLLALIALVPQLLGHSSLNWALGYASATLVAVSVMVEPVGATLLAWLILDEAPRTTSVLGGVFILAGVYLALRRPVNHFT